MITKGIVRSHLFLRFKPRAHAIKGPLTLSMLLQDAQARQGSALEQMSKAATDVGEATMAMPGRVQYIGSVLAELHDKHLKLLMLLQDAQARQGFALEQMSKAATDVGEATMAMPGRVQRIAAVLAELHDKHLKLLMLLQDAQARQGFALEQMSKAATEVGEATMAMPGRVQRIDAVLAELQNGDLKLRVRALEVERAARRSSILQVQ